MWKSATVISVVALLSGVVIAAIVVLEQRVGVAHDAQVRVALLSSQFDQSQALPWRVAQRGGPRRDNLAAIKQAERAFDVQLRGLSRTSPSAELAAAGAAARVGFAELVNIYRVGMRLHGWPQTVSTQLYRRQAATDGRVVGLLTTARRRYDARAGNWELDAKAGSAGAIIVLLGAFVAFFLRSETVARSRARALEALDAKSAELRHQALHDGLTGLPNRLLILDRAQQMLARTRRDGRTAAVMFIDLDGFKAINDTFGHHVGDDLLRAVAERLSLVMRASDTVGRLGGDEFVVLTESGRAEAQPERIAERLLEVLREPFRFDNDDPVRVSLSGSIGIAIGEPACAEELLQHADLALYEAKAAGRDRYVVFREEMQTAVHDRLSLEMDLRDAVAAHELALDYLPTFNLDTGVTLGFEALLRWQHPERGLIPPATLVPIAEQSNLIVEIGAWVLREACQQASEWHRQGHPIEIAVNVSIRQLSDPNFEATVEQALNDSGLPPSYLILEMTESTLMREPETTALRIENLKRHGIGIGIDDFGTGYSSLAYLQQFPVDRLKIDQSFVARIATSTEARALVHSLVQLGKSLNLSIVGEGIENEHQLESLREEACDYGQGFLVACPLSPDQAAAFLGGTQAGPGRPALGRFATHVPAAA